MQQDEQLRLQALAEYDILDTPPEKGYDNIAHLASQICQTPTSLISFVDEKRQWFKAKVGFSFPETAREYSFCNLMIQNSEDILIVPDARQDQRFKDNPLVTDDPNIVFYTGVPLLDPKGLGLGSLCVIDYQPRHLNEEQIQALQTLAHHTVQMLELRKSHLRLKTLKKALQQRDEDFIQFGNALAHDLRTPLRAISAYAGIALEEHSQSLQPEIIALFKKISEKTQLVASQIRDVLRIAHVTGNSLKSEPVNLQTLLDSMFHQAKEAGQIPAQARLLSTQLPTWYLDRPTLQMILDKVITLFAQSLSSSKSPSLQVSAEDRGNLGALVIQSRAIKFNQEVLDEVFSPKKKNAQITGYESRSLNLTLLKKAVQKLQGQINATCSAEEGTTFYIDFPITQPAESPED